jgi:hypothetical protein
MGFSEQVKLEAKRRSAFRYCIDHKVFVEVHHIIPESEGGPDTLDNAAPLCASCHDLFGGNPEKRKQIRQMRDHWWAPMVQREETLIARLDPDAIHFPEHDPNSLQQLRRPIAVYHCVYADETFEQSAQAVYEMVRYAQVRYPNQPRHLDLDIEDHRNC